MSKVIDQSIHLKRAKKEKLIIRKCHVCGGVTEAHNEQEKCIHCGKAFLPLSYFSKVHEHDPTKFKELFASSDELDESELIKGIFVLW